MEFYQFIKDILIDLKINQKYCHKLYRYERLQCLKKSKITLLLRLYIG